MSSLDLPCLKTKINGAWRCGHSILSHCLDPVWNELLKKYASWGNPECLFETWGDWESRVNQVSAKGGQWERAFVLRSEKNPHWVPEALRFHKRDSLEILKELMGDIKVVEHMKWAPEKVYNSKGERLYSELWTAVVEKASKPCRILR